MGNRVTPEPKSKTSAVDESSVGGAVREEQGMTSRAGVSRICHTPSVRV
jgi:hypothetical protein